MADLGNLIARASPEVLVGEIGYERLEQIESLLNGTSRGGLKENPAALGKVILALGGEGVLEKERIRAVLFALLPAATLEDFARRWTKRSYEKAADNALALASVPWRVGSGLAVELGNALDIPSEFLPRIEARQPTASVIEPFLAQPPLRPYQQEVKHAVLAALLRPGARVLVQMPTGAGKTRTMMSVLSDVARSKELFAKGRSILWLAHVEELCQQAHEAFEGDWRSSGSGPATTVRCYGAHRPAAEDYDGAFVVATYQKMAAMRTGGSAEFLRIAERVEIIVADEAHKVIAPTFRGVLEHESLRRAAIVGLTATPGRGISAESENFELASFFDKTLVGPSLGDNPIAELRSRGILAKVKFRAIESGVGVSLTSAETRGTEEQDLPASVLSRLASSTQRNRSIIDAIVNEVGHGRSCLVFACSVEHSRLLAAVLTLRGVSAAHLDSTVAPRLRRSLISRFKEGVVQVLLNFGVLSTGFDAPRVGTVVITRPTASVVLYSQMVGRGLRGPASGGNAECNLIDVRDNFNTFGGVDKVYAAFADYWS